MANKLEGLPPAICLMGTTATGKTDAAAALFDAFNAQIISVDSSLVYKGMNIGTAKPDAGFLAKYPHHLVDVCHPNERFSVADFYQQATSIIDGLSTQGVVPVLPGGSHFYFSALRNGLSDLPKANEQLRLSITQDAEQHGWLVMHQRLAGLDPLSAQRINANDAQRIQRALEVVMVSGKTVAEHNSHRKPPLKNKMVNIALVFSDRSLLHSRIEQRFNQMLDQGFQKEVEDLLNNGVSAEAASMKMIGYRQMLEYLQGDITYEAMRQQGAAATRQLAKRQLTWLRQQPNTVWWVDFGLKSKKFSPLTGFVENYLA